MTTTIVGISGSLRQASYNTAVLRAGAALMPAGSELAVETLHGVPLYDADAEAEGGIPPAVARLKEAVAAADGLLLATPEYNHGIPGVTKNAFDWLSRPPADSSRVFGGKPVAVLGATPGGFGTVLAQSAWLPVFRALGADFWTGGRLLVARAGDVIDAQGKITDARMHEALRQFLAGFVAHARRGASGRR